MIDPSVGERHTEPLHRDRTAKHLRSNCSSPVRDMTTGRSSDCLPGPGRATRWLPSLCRTTSPDEA